MCPDRRDGRGHRPGSGHVVVLDQHGVAETHPVIDPAAASHRVLLQCAQPGKGLAGVSDRRAGTGHRIDPRCGDSGYPGEVTQQVERGALGGEQADHRGADGDGGVPGC